MTANLTGESVTHLRYGKGVVIEHTDTSLTVRFGGDLGDKKFMYPSAFETFLKLSGQVSAEKVKTDLDDQKDSINAERERMAAETKACRVAERRRILEQRKAALKKRGGLKKA